MCKLYLNPTLFFFFLTRMEAEVLVGHPISTHTDIELAADELLKMGAKAVLMKGGHLFDNQEEKELRKRGAEAVGNSSSA